MMNQHEIKKAEIKKAIDGVIEALNKLDTVVPSSLFDLYTVANNSEHNGFYELNRIFNISSFRDLVPGSTDQISVKEAFDICLERALRMDNL